MKYLVTGSEGFIGRHLCAQLVRRGHEPIGLDRVAVTHRLDVADSHAANLAVIESMMKETDGVFHLAANADWRACEERPEQAWENIHGAYNVFSIAAKLKKPVAFTSSATVYGTPGASPIRTGDYPRPECLYAISKLVGEWIAWRSQEGLGLRVGIARIFNIYGAGQHRAVTYTSSFVPNIIRKLQARPEVLPCFGEPWVTRDFVYVTDAVDALIMLMHEAEAGRSVLANVGSGVATRHDEVVHALGDIMGCRPRLEYDHHLRGDVGRRQDVPYRAAISALRYMHWEPKVSLVDGLTKAVAAME